MELHSCGIAPRAFHSPVTTSIGVVEAEYDSNQLKSLHSHLYDWTGTHCNGLILIEEDFAVFSHRENVHRYVVCNKLTRWSERSAQQHVETFHHLAAVAVVSLTLVLIDSFLH